MLASRTWVLTFLVFSIPVFGTTPLEGTDPLTLEGDLAKHMVDGINRYLLRELEASTEQRDRHWSRDTSSHANYVDSVAPHRERFAKIIGVVDRREPVAMELVATTSKPSLVAKGQGYQIHAVRWPVLKGVDGEGLLLVPDEDPVADIVAIPDCDWTPEMLAGIAPGIPPEAQFARRLAENGCRVIIPVLLDRSDTYSGSEDVRMTNQPHREFLYRPAFQMGRHPIGYEVQKVLAAIDWFTENGSPDRPVSVIGYGEGGLIAFHAGAVDTRIEAVGVSGYFGPREGVWNEPIYRNVWSLLERFGDAEIASLVAPRPLAIEACEHPKVSGPPPEANGRSGAAPGTITTPPFAEVEREAERARDLVRNLAPPSVIQLTGNGEGLPGRSEFLEAFLKMQGIDRSLEPPSDPPQMTEAATAVDARMKRQVEQLLEHTQYLMRESEFARQKFWSKADASSLEKWVETSQRYRDYFWNEVIGPLPPASLPPYPRTRLVYDEPKFLGYEVVLDVFPDVIAYGILLVPKGMEENEKRPVVVCQHGLEGRAQDAADPDVDNHFYHQFACQLARRGFITYAPQNPYIGGDDFRVLQRMANPLKKSLFSFITRQHEQTLRWLGSLPFVDAERIGFYGLSYGGKTAMRVPDTAGGLLSLDLLGGLQRVDLEDHIAAI